MTEKTDLVVHSFETRIGQTGAEEGENPVAMRPNRSGELYEGLQTRLAHASHSSSRRSAVARRFIAKTFWKLSFSR